MAEERLTRLADGRYRWQPKRGAALTLTAEAFLKRLLALVPPKGLHLTCFHGVFAPNASLRATTAHPSLLSMEGDGNIYHMTAMKKVATNIPLALLEEASALAGLNQTQTLIAGLRELVAERKRHRLLELKGRIQVNFDAKRSRERRRR